MPATSPVQAPDNAPVAQLDRVTVSEAVGRGFDSRRARQIRVERLSARRAFLLLGVQNPARELRLGAGATDSDVVPALGGDIGTGDT